ncbi:GFA family protein [Litorisediminicola beolgyonensis]|uniref:GFA family protein n=1 Tax=Litorisediminicola beolgyonensis TaxID=1173614 RepID=A0ABW3ZM62_9RHOB
MIDGRCACGAVQFTSEAQPVNASACHCGMCRKMSGHAWASAQVPFESLRVTGNVRWFRLSATAERGICPSCGAFLFWRGDGEAEISVALGALEAPTGLRLEKHIFTADKGDYYEISDGLPQS